MTGPEELLSGKRTSDAGGWPAFPLFYHRHYLNLRLGVSVAVFGGRMALSPHTLATVILAEGYSEFLSCSAAPSV